MTQAEATVIEAAKKWLESKEAVLSADEARGAITETERAFDQAETDLTDAVYRLIGRGPRVHRRDER
jgi:hypothetical protein